MFTHHAEARMQQRAISHQAVDALMAYGEYRRHLARRFAISPGKAGPGCSRTWANRRSSSWKRHSMLTS